jgi:hypothetical protein
MDPELVKPVCDLLAQCMKFEENEKIIEDRLKWIESHLKLLETDEKTGSNSFLIELLEMLSEK